jgi:hypothetical protein
MDDPQREADRVGHADFAVVRIIGRQRRGWAPIVIAAWLIALVAAVGAGVLGRSASDPGGAPALALASGPVAAHGTKIGPAPITVAEPGLVGDAEPMAYSVVPDANGLTITGAVVARPVATVSIWVQDRTGKAITRRSITVDDPDSGWRPSRTSAFRVHIDLPASVAVTSLWVQIDAYNNLGHEIGSIRWPVSESGLFGMIRSRAMLTR